MSTQLTVYKASAGSGKTFRLSAEYIARLLNGEPDMHRHILAVTFTNKATTEMKERILQYLWEISILDEKEELNEFAQLLFSILPSDISRTEIRKRAQVALRSIIHDYDHFHVVTIDSFFQSLLTNLAHELGLAVGFKVDLDDKESIEKAVERLIETAPENKEVLKWVLKYIEERIDDSKKWDIRKELNGLAGELTKERFMLHEDHLLQLLTNSQQLEAYKSKLRKIQEDALQKLITSAKEINTKISQSGNGYADISNGNKTIGSYLQKLILGGVDAPSDSVNKMIDGSKEWLRKNDLKRPDLVNRMNQFREGLEEVEKLRSTVSHIVNTCHLTLKLLNPLRLLGEINQVLTDLNNENNKFMLAKTPLLFSKLVGDNDASFVFEKAGTTFRHIMIDEFQDTSYLQWNNFKNLLIENMSTGNDCLLVGDVKQGIYRFRGGDWNILENIQKEFKHIVPNIQRLEENYRSSNAIVDFNNALFPLATSFLDQRSHDTRITQLYNDVKQIANERSAGYVRLHLSEEEMPLDDLAEQIQLMHKKGVSYNDMAILLRYNNKSSDIIQYFSKNHPEIPMVSDEAYLLSSSRAIQLIIHALRYLNNENDTIARTYISKIYNNYILQKNLPWDIITLPESLPEQFSQNYESLKRTSIYKLCEDLIKIFEIEKLENEAAFVFTFLDQVMGFLNENTTDIENFLAKWEETYHRKAISMGDFDGVRILTIHKSKGLAFHTVFIPYCDWYIEKDHNKDLLWCQPTQPPFNTLPIVPVSIIASKQVTDSIYSQEYAYEHQQKRIENLNLLYVAFTRAEENMLIWSTCQKEKPLSPQSTVGDLLNKCIQTSSNLWQQQAEHVWEIQGRNPQIKEKKKEKKHSINPLKIVSKPLLFNLKRYQVTAQFRQSNEAKNFFDNSQNQPVNTYLQRGNVLHAIFSQINTIDDIEKAVNSSMVNGLIGTAEEGQQIKEWICKKMSQPAISQWFDKKWSVFNECTILSRDESGQLMEIRPDRVMTDYQNTIVIDYKFGKPNHHHRKQVQVYMQNLQEMGHKNIKGYIWYVLTDQIIQL